MMSLIDLDDEQRWVPTHVNVTVLRARGLRTKGKHGSRYLYAIVQVGKEKRTTGLVEKAQVPEWNEECCFELLPGVLEEGGRGAYPRGSGDLVLTVMHRVLIGLDVFLGQATLPLDRMFWDGACPRDEWFKLNSKAGRKEKERGELQVTVQFTRNNMTASMFDLTMKDKPRSALGKLKDRVTGRKRGDVESSSAIVPGRYAALSGPPGQPFGEESGGAGEPREAEAAEDRRSKVKDFFKGRLGKSSDTRSCSSLASDSSVSSLASDNLGPPPSLSLLSDPPSSPIYTSKVRVDTHYGEADLAKKVLTSQHTTKVLTHKRAFSDEASKITTVLARTNLPVESLKGQTMTQSKSSLCINGSHVYDSEPSTPRSSAALPSKLVLLEKCSPLSRSLQNLTKRSEDKGSFAEGRRWSFDKTKKEEKEEDKEARASSLPTRQAQLEGPPVQAAMPVLLSTAESSDKGKKLRKTLFSGGRSDSLPAKSDLNQAGSASEGRLRGWFGSGDSLNKPRLEVSPKVESSSDVSPPFPLHSPAPPQCSSPGGHVSPNDQTHTTPITPSSSPSSTPISPSNPFLQCMQRNPFFEELVGEGSPRLPPCSSPGSSPFHYTTVPSPRCAPSPAREATNMASIKRERPRPVARQVSLPALLPKAAPANPSNRPAPRAMSESAGEWEDSFDAFASSRLNSPKGSLPQMQKPTGPASQQSRGHLRVHSNTKVHAQEMQRSGEEPPPLPPRRLLRTSVNEIYSDGWLHRGQELAVHNEARLLSQTGAASRQRGREGECKRNAPSVSPDPHSCSETSGSLSVVSQGYTNVISPGLTSEGKLKKFKYEPLEDDVDCWGGMLFEQDLYGRVCRGTYGQPKGNGRRLSLSAARSNVMRENSGPETLLDGGMSITDILRASSAPLPQSEALDITSPTAQQMEFFSMSPAQTTCVNNNVSFSLTTEDLNMNVNNSDFGFIDSEGSSQSEATDTLKGLDTLGGSFPQLPLDAPIVNIYHENATPEGVFTLKDTYIPEINSSYEITASSNNLRKISPVCQEGCDDCRCELSNAAPPGRPANNGHPPAFGTESSGDETSGVEVFKRAQSDCDDNGNPPAELGALKRTASFSGVVSARFRPKGFSTGSSPISRSQGADAEFEQLLSLVQNISQAGEGPLSYQPAKTAVSSMLALDSSVDQKHRELNVTWKPPEISFEDLHAKVAPNPRTPPMSKIEQSLPAAEASPSAPSSLPLSADAKARPHPPPVCSPSIHPSSTGPPSAGAAAAASLAVAPNTSCSTTSATEQPLSGAQHSLLPEETQPASNLPRQESRSHPVKPLTSSQSEKRDGRSVLEKLKSTIHPGRSAHQSAAEPERSQEAPADNSAQYQHLTNMELISLLLQQEMDMQKQQAASQRQGAQLERCEAELKKVKLQVRDLEDYIDNLLLRIMEQTPTLLQVRARHK